MKLNPIQLAVRIPTGAKKSPVLLAVTPPRTGERNAAGGGEPPSVHCRPRALLPGGGRCDSDGVTLLARCLDDEVVRGPDSPAHYPAGRHPPGVRRGRPPAPRRGRGGVGHDAPVERPGVRAPAHLPGRRPAGPRLRPSHRPDWERCLPSGRVSASSPGCCCAPWDPTGLRPTWRRPTRG